VSLTTYDRLEAYLRAFAEGHFGLLILVGAGGLAKSHRDFLDLAMQSKGKTREKSRPLG
jgi:hypothetical protein